MLRLKSKEEESFTNDSILIQDEGTGSTSSPFNNSEAQDVKTLKGIQVVQSTMEGFQTKGKSKTYDLSNLSPINTEVIHNKEITNVLELRDDVNKQDLENNLIINEDFKNSGSIAENVDRNGIYVNTTQNNRNVGIQSFLKKPNTGSYDEGNDDQEIERN